VSMATISLQQFRVAMQGDTALIVKAVPPR
jgi:hypothetical protein